MTEGGIPSTGQSPTGGKPFDAPRPTPQGTPGVSGLPDTRRIPDFFTVTPTPATTPHRGRPHHAFAATPSPAAVSSADIPQPPSAPDQPTPPAQLPHEEPRLDRAEGSYIRRVSHKPEDDQAPVPPTPRHDRTEPDIAILDGDEPAHRRSAVAAATTPPPPGDRPVTGRVPDTESVPTADAEATDGETEEPPHRRDRVAPVTMAGETHAQGTIPARKDDPAKRPITAKVSQTGESSKLPLPHKDYSSLLQVTRGVFAPPGQHRDILKGDVASVTSEFLKREPFFPDHEHKAQLLEELLSGYKGERGLHLLTTLIEQNSAVIHITGGTGKQPDYSNVAYLLGKQIRAAITDIETAKNAIRRSDVESQAQKAGFDAYIVRLREGLAILNKPNKKDPSS